MNVELLRASHIDWADRVFITAMLVQKDSLREVAQLCKAKGKGVVLGGPYVTTTVEDLRHAAGIGSVEANTCLLSHNITNS